MKQHLRKRFEGILIVFVLSVSLPVKADLFSVTDVNPDPNVFECDLTAIQNDVTIWGTNVHAFTYKDEAAPLPPASAGIPVKVIRAKVGDLIVCRFKNQLPTDSASIHWHGIELDNDSDGTAVTQDAVLPTQSYTYRFQTFRPGVFWFHSHILPGNTLFGGMYGIMIIENNIESSLIADGILPSAANTHTLALSDIEFDGTGKVGRFFDGSTKTINELIEMCHLDGLGEPGGNNGACLASSGPGAVVLVNGQHPDSGAQTPMINVKSGERIRLRLLNESISRHFRMKLIGGSNPNLYRIGGQGGLLDNIILEGGMKGFWDTLYTAGEITIGSGIRADVIMYPTGSDGEVIQLVGNPLTPPYKISQSLPANYPIAYFKISGSGSDSPPAVGDPILAGTAEDIENIKSGPVVSLVEPAPFGGSHDETIHLTTAKPTGPVPYVKTQPGIDQWAAVLDGNAGNGDWLLVPRPPNSRYAHVGDVLELTVRNDTDAVHPYHLHGFSMQPIRLDHAGTNLFTFPYDEFLDTIDVFPGHSYVFRVRVDDRAKFCDITPNVPPDAGPVLEACTPNLCGGVVGRWLYHCHIVHHGALGMIGEVTILPHVDSPPQIICPADIVTTNTPGLCSAVVDFTVTATDDCGDVTIVSVPPSGSVFPVGTTLVTATATDSIGQISQCTFTVTVNDVEKPVITSSSVSVPVLWSPNHDLINVGLSATATDNCAAPITLTAVVYGDEDDESPSGDGNFAPDAKNIALGALRLRTERNSKGDGRVYLIVITATDGAGNQSSAVQTVVTPRDQSPKSLPSVTAQATAAKNYFIANGVPPPGYFVIGDGPIVGPKQ